LRKYINRLYKWSSPKYFYYGSRKLLPLATVLTLACFAYGTISGLFLAPIDYQQKEAFRIIYVHVPTAILSVFIYFFVGVNSAIYLIWRVKLSDVLATAAAPIGAAFTALALITGSVWGKPMWGTWWVWDARLTSELILLFLYMGYIGLRSAVSDLDAAAKASAILAVVGLIDVPIIHYSVEWWQTLHQGATISKFGMPSIAFEMLVPLMVMLLAFALFFFTVCIMRARNLLLLREQRSTWVRNLLLEG